MAEKYSIKSLFALSKLSRYANLSFSQSLFLLLLKNANILHILPSNLEISLAEIELKFLLFITNKPSSFLFS
jgi:hypothetical protein